MKKQLMKIYTSLAATLAAVMGLAPPALAASPVTGDERGQMMGVVIALLIISLILIVGFLVLSAKGKGKKKK